MNEWGDLETYVKTQLTVTSRGNLNISASLMRMLDHPNFIEIRFNKLSGMLAFKFHQKNDLRIFHKINKSNTKHAASGVVHIPRNLFKLLKPDKYHVKQINDYWAMEK